MLPRTASRLLVNGRPRPTTLRSLFVFQSAHASRWKSSKPTTPPFGKAEVRKRGVYGPVTNQTWGPDLGGRAEPVGEQPVPGEQPEIDRYEQPETSSESGRRNNNIDADGVESQSQTQQPLPDLTKGIPSTLEAELSQTSPRSPQDTEGEHASPNITDDPANPEDEPGAGRGGQRPKEEYISSIDRRRTRVANILYLVAALAITGTGLWAGRPWPTEKEEIAHPDAPNGYGPGAIWKRIQVRFSTYFGSYMEPVVPELLPTMPPEQRMPYTLVLSLEDLLVHSKWTRQKGWEVAKRPGVDYFLRYLASYYELVIFTTVASMNADMVIRKLDPYRIVQFPLFREHTRYVGGDIVKDLSYLNRDLSKVIVVDTVKSHVKLQPENAIIIPKWNGQASDAHAKDLVALIPFLEFVASMNIQDTRRLIKSFEGKSVAEEFAVREARMREEFKKKQADKGGSRRGASALSGLTKALGLSTDAGRVPGDPLASDSQGKMLLDQYRERGIQQYRMLDQEIKERGEAFLKEIEAEEKKMMDDSMKGVQSGVQDFFSSWFGIGGKKDENGPEKKDG